MLAFKNINRLGDVRLISAMLPALLMKSKDTKIVFVDSNTGVDSARRNGEDITGPFATIDYAIGRCVANNGDEVWVLPRHSETVTAPITMDVAGVSVFGLMCGNLRPTVTGNGTIDAVSIEAANCSLENINFGVPGTDEQTSFVNVAAAKCVLKNLRGVGSTTAKNVVDCITLASGADDVRIEDVRIYNTTVAVNSFLSIEAAIARMVMKDVHFFGTVATAGIIDSAAATHIFWEKVSVGTVGTAMPAVILDSNPTGLIKNCMFSGTHTTLASNAQLGNALRLFKVDVLEETDASKQGAPIPAVDAD